MIAAMGLVPNPVLFIAGFCFKKIAVNYLSRCRALNFVYFLKTGNRNSATIIAKCREYLRECA